jgi:hypothetical protein
VKSKNFSKIRWLRGDMNFKGSMYSGSKACDSTSAYGSNKFLKIKVYFKKRITGCSLEILDIFRIRV